jgi:hypothetical protein
VTENRVLRRIFVQKKWWNIGECCLMTNFVTYTARQIRMITSRRMRGAGEVARMGEKINTYRASVRKPEGKKSLRRFRRGDGRLILKFNLER